MDADVTTPAGRAALRALSERATAGPWVMETKQQAAGHTCDQYGASEELAAVCAPLSDNLSLHIADMSWAPRGEPDAAFIAVARTALPAALDLIERLEAEIAALNNPDFDATDAAHPAWWRGNDAGTYAVTERIRQALDGTDNGSGVIGYGPLEQVRRDVLALRTLLAECAKALAPFAEYVAALGEPFLGGERIHVLHGEPMSAARQSPTVDHCRRAAAVRGKVGDT